MHVPKVEIKGKKNLTGLKFVTLANQEIRFFEKIGFLTRDGSVVGGAFALSTLRYG
jgi:hypothetical protein